ncbi:MAG: molecular chaperone DnaK [Bdellovibrionota bacterium]
MGKVVGIDLGTSYSCVACVIDGKATVLKDSEGRHTQPSVASFLPDGSVVVGHEAKKRTVIDPRNTVYSAKRLIGRKFFSEEVTKAKQHCAYEIVEGPNAEVKIKIRDRDYALPEISALVLRKMKQVAEDALGEEVTQAVITCPAYFNDGQRQATKDAGRIAGLEVLRIINEPTAAALAYGYGKGLQQRVVVYDLGGGTFDVSILEIGNDVFEVISTAGDTYLGGDDFDDRILQFLVQEFHKSTGYDIKDDPETMQKLKSLSERVKWALSERTEVKIDVPNFVLSKNGPLHLQTVLTRNHFQQMCMDLVQRTFKVCDEAFQNARLTINDVDSVLLVGGSTRMPIIRTSVEKYFFKTPQSNIDPDEVVAVGASIQGASLTDTTQKSLLLDVTPMSLGIGTVGGLVKHLIEKNTPIPTEQTHIFTTTRDNQPSVRIMVYQGESTRQTDSDQLGEFTLTGIRAARQGEPKIQVSFQIDTDGILNVSAKDLDTNQEQSITIMAYGSMAENEISKAQAAAPELQRQ